MSIFDFKLEDRVQIKVLHLTCASGYSVDNPYERVQTPMTIQCMNIAYGGRVIAVSITPDHERALVMFSPSIHFCRSMWFDFRDLIPFSPVEFNFPISVPKDRQSPCNSSSSIMPYFLTDVKDTAEFYNDYHLINMEEEKMKQSQVFSQSFERVDNSQLVNFTKRDLQSGDIVQIKHGSRTNNYLVDIEKGSMYDIENRHTGYDDGFKLTSFYDDLTHSGYPTIKVIKVAKNGLKQVLEHIQLKKEIKWDYLRVELHKFSKKEAEELLSKYLEKPVSIS